MRHRPEIDGLRALAVLPVILFHAGVPGLGGGFVGVDVFFVISGFLITSIIATDLERGDFSLARFYERRARRILPALFAVMAACVPFGALWLYAEDQKSLGQSMAAATVFASNIFFWRQRDYFDVTADLKPLLHTWSLGVEEQFYLLFPLLLMAAWRLGRARVGWMLGVLFVASLALAHAFALSRPNFAFFLLPTRGWELIAGSLAALIAREGAAPWLARRARQLLAWAGLAAIGVAMAAFGPGTPVPGLPLLLPVLGTVAVLTCAHADTVVGRWLACRPLVGIGLISYSAYLWHQPVLVFARQRSIEPLGLPAIGLLCVAMLLLAHLSWRFIEQPWRTRRLAPDRRRLALGATACALVLLLLGGALTLTARDDPEKAVATSACGADSRPCHVLPAASLQVALWGDSYGQMLAGSLGEALNARGVSLHALTQLSCPSLLGTRRNEPERLGTTFADDCQAHNQQALDTIRSRRIDVVVLTSAYLWYLSAANHQGQPILLDATDPARPPHEFIPARLAETVRMINASGARVVLVTPHPVLPQYEKTRKQLHFGSVREVLLDPAAASDARALLLGALAAAGAPFIEVDGRSLLCSAGRCPATSAAGDLLLYDGSHLGTTLARRAASLITATVIAGAPGR